MLTRCNKRYRKATWGFYSKADIKCAATIYCFLPSVSRQTFGNSYLKGYNKVVKFSVTCNFKKYW